VDIPPERVRPFPIRTAALFEALKALLANGLTEHFTGSAKAERGRDTPRSADLSAGTYRPFAGAVDNL
jgi:hypothetical protein